MYMKVHIAVWVFVGVFAVSAAGLRAAETTVTGKVGDAMCGMKHAIDNEVACTRGCVKNGSDYALIVKDQAYTLTASDDLKATLSELAGQRATVKGELLCTSTEEEERCTIVVASVVAAK